MSDRQIKLSTDAEPAHPAEISLPCAAAHGDTGAEDILRNRLRELNHMSKNNLMIIQSLLRIQSARNKTCETGTVLKEARARVQAIALVHKHFRPENGPERINAGDYIRELSLAAMEGAAHHGRKIRLSVHADDLMMGGDELAHLGLFVNEVILNSIRHAFNDGREGGISISLLDRTDGGFQVEVTDSGIGLPEDFDIRRSGGFGMEIIRAMAQQLKGRLDISSDGGARFMLNRHAGHGRQAEPGDAETFF